MGALIHLAAPSPAGPDADRVSYSVGRSLTAADFARQSRYIEARLLGLAPATPGVITGLGISPARFDSANGTTGLTTFTIGTGSGIGIDGHLVRVTTPITVAWADLVQAVTNGARWRTGATSWWPARSVSTASKDRHLIRASGPIPTRCSTSARTASSRSGCPPRSRPCPRRARLRHWRSPSTRWLAA